MQVEWKGCWRVTNHWCKQEQRLHPFPLWGCHWTHADTDGPPHCSAVRSDWTLQPKCSQRCISLRLLNHTQRHYHRVVKSGNSPQFCCGGRHLIMNNEKWSIERDHECYCYFVENLLNRHWLTCGCCSVSSSVFSFLNNYKSCLKIFLL